MVHTRAWPQISPSTKIYFRCHFRGLFKEDAVKLAIFWETAENVHFIILVNEGMENPNSYRDFGSFL